MSRTLRALWECKEELQFENPVCLSDVGATAVRGEKRKRDAEDEGDDDDDDDE